MSLSRLLLILGVCIVSSSFPSFPGKLGVLAIFLMLADRLTLDGDDGELPPVFDEFVDFLKVPGGLVALPELPFPCLDREEWLTLC